MHRLISMVLFRGLGSIPSHFRYDVLLAQRDHNYQAFTMGSLILAAVCLLYILQLTLGESRLLDYWHKSAYLGLYSIGAGGSLVIALLFRGLHRKVSLTGETVLALSASIFTLGLTTCLTWIDLFYGKEYTGIATGLIGVNILLSAGPFTYIALGAGTLLVFTAGLYLFHPGFGTDMFLPALIFVLLYTFLGLLIQSGRRKNVLLTLRLKKANDELKDISFRDPLTGVRNRRFLMEFLEQQTALERRHRQGLTIILMDLDHFKKINDTLGHPVGDSVLKEAARIAEGMLRESDILARYGGEEFMAVLPHASMEDGRMVADRIRAKVEAQSFAGLPWTQTASFGVAQLLYDENLESLVSRADEALYRAKNLGRNRVEG